ncbi:hypothetical protein [Roseofilum capinflatum]|uniref:Uncharacterized protein n=1 Tax=Roseofilum capinflatum BLCC-M114 TaxID=3022440 RepID=A0ABT7B7I6_9CYAN|nr:hypothetical protein [Roseofilum capinflatum]MDJ1175137.1 hypothetical protein [Roseofilum capinflatum BLCC-M114]
MTSLPYTPPPRKQATPSEPTKSQTANETATPSQKYSPSVPISVYRDLASEVKEKQVMLESLRQQNQQLVQQNQQLRGEIEQLVRSVVRLQQIAHAYEPSIAVAPPSPPRQAGPEPLTSEPTFTPESRVENPPAAAPESDDSDPPVDLPPSPEDLPLFSEEQQRPYPHPSAPERSSDLNGIGLAIAIFVIAAMAGTASFLIVRPLIGEGNPK